MGVSADTCKNTGTCICHVHVRTVPRQGQAETCQGSEMHLPRSHLTLLHELHIAQHPKSGLAEGKPVLTLNLVTKYICAQNGKHKKQTQDSPVPFAHAAEL